jgi:4-amino-4-deoxy-L-arabinose transferase-like glycosyltransferase
MDRSTRAWFVLAASTGIAYGVLLFTHVSRGVGGSDPAGYANTARDIGAGRIVLPIAGLSILGLDNGWAPVFTPLAHAPGPRPGTMVPYYPPGFPLHIALAAVVAGWSAAPFLVSPIAAVLCLGLTFVLGRQLGLSRPLAFAAAAILGAWAVFLFHGIQPMSDVTAALWSTAAVAAALRSRKRTGWATAAGAAFGLAVLVRPTNVLLLPALALALPWRAPAVSLFAAGGLPFAGFFAAWNWTAFGSALETGYTHQFSSELALSNFGPRLARYAARLTAELSALVPLGWLASGADRRVPARDRALLFVWFAPIFLFYCFWGPSDNWTYDRYFLPAAPALVVGFLFCLRDLAEGLPGRAYRAVAIAAVLAFVLVWERRAVRQLGALGGGDRSAVYPEASRAAAALGGGANALVVSMEFSAALRYYTAATPIRWDLITPGDFALLRARAAQRGLRLCAVLLPDEVAAALEHVPGPWVFVGNVRQAGLWELPAPAP